MWDNLLMSKVKYLILLALFLGAQSCSMLYVIKQGVYQLKLISGAESMEQVLRSRNLDMKERRKLELISDVRKFCQQKLHLKADRNYRNVNMSWRHIIHTVSASCPLSFRSYLWRFPIIGSVPYKGFFDEADAALEEQELKAQGLDTQKRTVTGYSTLGFFSDPVLPSMLTLGDDALIELIIHELAHATIYFSNQTPFNETFANFVGKTGTKAYIAYRFGPSSEELRRVHAYHQQLQIYRDFFHDLYRDLDNLYSSYLPEKQKNIEKIKLIDEAKDRYAELPIDSSFKGIDWARINNAYLLSFKNYNQDDAVFEELLTKVHGDFGAFLNEVNWYGNTSDPFASLRSRLSRMQ
jgi:predicted aminopeptidase